MESMLFYPTLTSELIDICGLEIENYLFQYKYNESVYDLSQSGGAVIKLKDPLDIWKIEDDGLIFKNTIRIAYPENLFGENGIACRGAELGICIIWTNKKLTQTGYIMPKSDITTPKGRICSFEHYFGPKTISGDLELKTVMYIKKKSPVVLPDEGAFVNEDGVTVGEINLLLIDLSNSFMEFPIEEVNSAEEPLWWVEFSEWEDPTSTDLFTKDNICLYLNTHYSSCPTPATAEGGNMINNFDLLVDILAQTYHLILLKLSDDELKATKLDINLAENSICSIMHQFIERLPGELAWESPERLLKSLQLNIRKLLLEDQR